LGYKKLVIAMRKRLDWDYWRQTYLSAAEGFTLKSLSELPGAPAYDSIRKIAKAEDWDGQRKQFKFQSQMAVLSHPKFLEQAEHLNRLIDLCEMLVRHINQAQKLQKKAMACLDSVDPSEIKVSDAIAMLKLGIEIERLTEGLITQRTAVDVSNLSDSALETIVKGVASPNGWTSLN